MYYEQLLTPTLTLTHVLLHFDQSPGGGPRRDPDFQFEPRRGFAVRSGQRRWVAVVGPMHRRQPRRQHFGAVRHWSVRESFCGACYDTFMIHVKLVICLLGLNNCFVTILCYHLRPLLTIFSMLLISRYNMSTLADNHALMAKEGSHLLLIDLSKRYDIHM